MLSGPGAGGDKQRVVFEDKGPCLHETTALPLLSHLRFTTLSSKLKCFQDSNVHPTINRCRFEKIIFSHRGKKKPAQSQLGADLRVQRHAWLRSVKKARPGETNAL